jgi:hypothetical protein
VRCSANISECGRYRWTLGRWWNERERVCWIMLNPSTADAERDDPTLKAIIRRSQAWDCGALTVVNLYPFRTSSPRECQKWLEAEGNGEALQRNLREVTDAIRRSAWVIAAWGAAPWAVSDGRLVAKIARSEKVFIHCLGVTSSGAPKHPLARGRHRIPAEQEPMLWHAL